MSRAATLIDLFLTFSNFGEHPALIHRTGVRRRVLSYAGLDEQARRMATLLAAQGIGPGDRVALWGPNSPGWVIGFWGILLRGAIVVPIDFTSDPLRAAEIIDHAGAALLLRSRFKERPTAGGEILLEELPWRLRDYAAQTRPVTVQPDDTAELVYTSGTTGTPKGVVLSHRNLCANLEQIHLHLPVLDRSFCLLSLLPLSHLFEQTAGLLVPLSCGASVVQLTTLKPGAIMEAFGEETIHAVITVPRFLQLLRRRIEEKFAARGLEKGFARLRTAIGKRPVLRKLLFMPLRRRFGRDFRFFVSGGGALDPALFAFWNDLGMTVIEGYGLTECSPVLAANTLEEQVAGAVGRALPGVELRIVAGEVQARGENVFAGYFNNPAATAAAFSADGWFRSGDLGSFDPRGWLQLKGRSKELIVTGAGVNVYPEPIENLLNALPGVREACVIGLDRGQGEEVHAVIIPDGSGRPLPEIVAAANAGLDPLQRITGASLWPETDFPRTPTLKVRKFLVRNRLCAPEQAAGRTSSDRLLELIAAATATPTAQISEDRLLLADLGLTSIARLELVSAIEQHFRIDLDEALIDAQTTVAGLRSLVAGQRAPARGDHARLWCSRRAGRFLRRLLDYGLHFPLLRLVCTVEAQGLEHLRALNGPVLLVANHVSYLDQPVLMRALPPFWRYATATAAWEEFFFAPQRSLPQRLWRRIAYEYVTLANSIFPLSQQHGFRRALRFMGRLVDRGDNILIFPEGERTLDGQLLPFRQGLGIMATELDIPVIPVRLCGLEAILPRGANLPRRGRVEVRFGAPLIVTGERPEAIVARVREAIAAL